ncbi:GNAT family N-acetyltransferase [Bacillus subtilis]|nr:GNAT family N-acetyltransferase [Bacillus subtilis]MCB7459496.1 GNAT family N-acetyltransferase [Bacillus subtilis]
MVVAALLKHGDKPDINLIDYIAAGGITLIKMRLKNLQILKRAGIEVLGVSPFYQGKSLGSKMINDCLISFISKCGGGILALIMNTDLNRSFYKSSCFYI